MPKYSGVMRVVVVGLILARRWMGTRTERKRTSSVMGPATKLR